MPAPQFWEEPLRVPGSELVQDPGGVCAPLWLMKDTFAYHQGYKYARLKNTILETMGSSTSHNSIGLHGLLEGEIYITFFFFYFPEKKNLAA
jgi:hypothetical protein